MNFSRHLAAVVLVAAAAATATAQTNNVRALTIEDCVTRAVANNLDVQIQRVNPGIQYWGIVSAQGVFDPSLTGGESYTDATQPLNPEQSASLHLSSIKQQQLQSNLGLGGKLPTGTAYSLQASDTRFSGTLTSNFFYTGTAGLSLTQPLLKNFGPGVNTAFIQVARKSYQIARQNLLLQMINTIASTETAYYELVFSIEDHKAKVETRALARELLDQTRQRMRIGVQSPLDVTQAEAGAAETEQGVILAARTIKDNENVLKHLISQNVSEFQGASLLPVNYPVVEMVETDLARSIRTAFELRPDYLAARHAVEQQNILVKYNRNQLWPEVDLQGSYGFNGAGTSFGNLIDNTASGNNPVWTIGVTVSVPIGNRQARASYHTAQLQAAQSLLQLKNLEQQILIAVDNAVGHVRTNLESVNAAREALRLAQESLAAEQVKLRTGTSTTFLVLQAQSQLAAARSAEIRARADYAESLVALAQAEGSTLAKYHIVVQNDQ